MYAWYDVAQVWIVVGHRFCGRFGAPRRWDAGCQYRRDRHAAVSLVEPEPRSWGKLPGVIPSMRARLAALHKSCSSSAKADDPINCVFDSEHSAIKINLSKTPRARPFIWGFRCAAYTNARWPFQTTG